MEGTKRGSYLSLIAIGTIITLFLLETRAFLRTEYVDPFVEEVVYKRYVSLFLPESFSLVQRPIEWYLI